ncbi:MAG: hypothetical protein JWO89_3802 [Verrucomicrobiaceae bacterium]|nr:hypothetical protein [Verrucomicrobiaceae bacterium]
MVSLNPGTNIVIVRVTSEDGSTSRDYTLTIIRAVSVDTIRPAAAIASPLAAARVNEGVNGTTIVKGSASDNKGIALVEVRTNDGDFVQVPFTLSANHLNASYSALISPAPGLNTIAVRSTDTSGNVSMIVSRSFTYVVMRPLSLGTTEGGTVKVSPAFFNGKAQVGVTYTVTATPRAGYLMDFWDAPGLVLAMENPTKVTFVMPSDQPEATVTAHFLFNPFPAVAGSYSGIIGPKTGSATNIRTTGFFTATVSSPSGLFTGKVTIGGSDIPLTGRFDPHTGAFNLGNASSNLALALTLDINDPAHSGSAKITGTITQRKLGLQQSVSTFSADLATFSAAHHVPAFLLAVGNPTQNGVFTVALPARTSQTGLTSAQYPQGSGIGRVTVTTAGVATLAGTLADGTAVTCSAPLSRTFQWPLFALLYNRQGAIAAQTIFNSLPNTDLSASSMLWIKPSSPGKYYPWGWESGIYTSLMGAHYTVPYYSAALPLLRPVSLAGNAVLTFNQGGLSAPLVKAVNVATTNKVTPAGMPDATFAATINATTGLVSGSFNYPSLPVQTTKFSGAILQKGFNRGAFGWFLTPPPVNVDGDGQGGNVSLLGR